MNYSRKENLDTIGHFAESKSILKGLSRGLKTPATPLHHFYKYLELTVLQRGVTCSKTKSDPHFWLC